MKFLKYSLMAFILVMLVSSCGGGGSSTAPEAAAPVPAVTTGTLRFHNGATVQIDHGYLSPTTTTTWGPDQLSTPLLAGTYGDLTNITAGTYDAKARVIRTFSIYSGYLYTIPIVAGSTFNLYCTNSSFTGSIKMFNNALPASNITELYVSPTTSTTWGVNQITSPILPSASAYIYDVFTTPTATYDIGIRFASDPILPAGPVWAIPNKTVESLSVLNLNSAGTTSTVTHEY